MAFQFLVILVLGTVSAGSTFATASEAPKVIVTTDMQVYEAGDVVVISGGVSRDITREGELVAIQVFYISGELVKTGYVSLTPSGSFEYKLPVDGKTLARTGTYKIVATYAGDYRGEASFELFSGSRDPLCIVTTCTYELRLNNTTYQIRYRTAGTIQNVTVDVDSKSLIINVMVDVGSALNVLLPRDLIDATEPDEDGTISDANFTVFVNGQETTGFEFDLPDYLQNEINSTRLLNIFLMTEGVNEVEITGTRVVPEFGLMPSMVVGIVIGAMLTLSRLKRARNSQ